MARITYSRLEMLRLGGLAKLCQHGLTVQVQTAVQQHSLDIRPSLKQLVSKQYATLPRGCWAGTLKPRQIKVLITPRLANNAACSRQGRGPRNILNFAPIPMTGVPRVPQMQQPFLGLINARSVRDKVWSIVDHVCDRKLDVVGITGSWLSGDDTDKITMHHLIRPGQKLIHTARTTGTGGGVAMLHLSGLTVNQEKVRSPFQVLRIHQGKTRVQTKMHGQLWYCIVLHQARKMVLQ